VMKHVHRGQYTSGPDPAQQVSPRRVRSGRGGSRLESGSTMAATSSRREEKPMSRTSTTMMPIPPAIDFTTGLDGENQGACPAEASCR
jgi:hypothetical protein